MIGKDVFIEILHGMREYDDYLKVKHDAVGMACFSSIQKSTAAMRMLAYGAPTNSQDDYFSHEFIHCIECMYRFCREVVTNFGKDYLRGSNEEETHKIMAQNVAEDFLGCLEA
jgi:hypothetical protein